MVGETIPSHWVYDCVFCPNHPLSSESIPLNTMASDMILEQDSSCILAPPRTRRI